MSEQKSEITQLKEIIVILTKKIEKCSDKLNDNVNQLAWDDFLPKILPWFGTMIAFVFAAIIFNHLSPHVNAAIEFMTKWTCTLALVVSGIICAALMKFNRAGQAFISIGFASIFTNYLAYVLLDYGALHPLTAANGFNIATIIQLCAIVFCLYILRFKCPKIKS